MIDAVSCMMRAATRKPSDRLNILTGITHERFASGWASTNCHYWLLKGLSGFKDSWNERYAQIPDNHTILPPCPSGQIRLPDDLVPDLIVAQHRFGQFQALKPLADQLHVPLLTIEHTLPRNDWTTDNRRVMRSMSGDVDTFITNESRSSWGWDETNSTVVEHGIDTLRFAPRLGVARHTKVVSVVNDYINRGDILGFDLWQEATRGLPVLPIGDTPGLSEAAASVDDLATKLAEASIFLCTARSSPIPMSLLEAMSSGLACVCIRQSAVATVIKHSENGLLADTASELCQYLRKLRLLPALREELGRNARKTVVERFPLSRFASDWERVFRAAAELTHKP